MASKSLLCCIVVVTFIFCDLNAIIIAQPLVGHTTKSAEEKFPFAVLIIGKNQDGTEERLCVGSLISRNQVLTAATCMQNWKLDNLLVVISVPQGIRNRIKKLLHVASVVTYRDFVDDAINNNKIIYPQIEDIAIIELSIPDTGIEPARVSERTDLPPAGSSIKIIGFLHAAKDRSPLLKQYSSIGILRKQLCHEQAKLLSPNYRKYTWSNQLFCAQNSLSVLAMDGDFGGAAIDNNGDIIGITFRGRPADQPVKILHRGQANLLLNLGYYKDFIQKYKH